jgi:hypothetical protein
VSCCAVSAHRHLREHYCHLSASGLRPRPPRSVSTHLSSPSVPRRQQASQRVQLTPFQKVPILGIAISTSRSISSKFLVARCANHDRRTALTPPDLCESWCNISLRRVAGNVVVKHVVYVRNIETTAATSDATRAQRSITQISLCASGDCSRSPWIGDASTRLRHRLGNRIDVNLAITKMTLWQSVPSLAMISAFVFTGPLWGLLGA